VNFGPGYLAADQSLNDRRGRFGTTFTSADSKVFDAVGARNLGRALAAGQ
jgi:hypothetical protein